MRATRESIAARLDREAHWIKPGRIEDGALLEYSGVVFPRNPWQGIERELRKLQATGGLTDERTDYLFDIMSEDGDLLDTFSLTREAFNRLRGTWKFVRERDDD